MGDRTEKLNGNGHDRNGRNEPVRTIVVDDFDAFTALIQQEGARVTVGTEWQQQTKNEDESDGNSTEMNPVVSIERQHTVFTCHIPSTKVVYRQKGPEHTIRTQNPDILEKTAREITLLDDAIGSITEAVPGTPVSPIDRNGKPIPHNDWISKVGIATMYLSGARYNQNSVEVTTP